MFIPTGNGLANNQQLYTDLNLPTSSTAVPTANLNTGNSWFNQNNSMMDNIGQTANLIGAGLSLADMINNFGLQKDAIKLNMKGMRQNMAQSQEAFDRNVARQDRSLAAMADAERRARLVNGGG